MMTAYPRRGVALLLALVALSLLSVTAVGVLRLTTHRMVAGDMNERDLQARTIVDDLQPMLLAWSMLSAPKTSESAFKETTALDPAAPTPWLKLHQDDLSITIQRFSLSGRLHVRHLDSFAASGLPPTLQSLSDLSASAARDDLPMLLDEIAVALDSPHPVYPMPDEDSATAIGWWLTGHGTGALDIQSAPVPLLRAALAGLDPNAVSAAMTARSHGEAIPADVARDLINDRAGQIGAARASRYVPLTDQPSAYAWSVRVEQDARTHLWWIVTSASPAPEIDEADGLTLARHAHEHGGWRIAEWRRLR